MQSNHVLTRSHPVLLVDDSLDIHSLVRAHLRKEPVELSTAECGPVALEMARESPPDLILLDVDLPGADGFTICRALNSDERTSNVPVIFLTGSNDAASRLRGLAAGAVDYVTKPFDPAELRLRVKTWLRVRELMGLLEEKAHVLARAEAWESGRSAVLQMVLENRPLEEIISGIVDLARAQFPLAMGAAAVTLAAGSLKLTPRGLPPGLAAAWEKSILPIAAAVCSAASAGEGIVCHDPRSNAAWAPIADTLEAQGVASVWTAPLTTTGGDALGMLTILNRSARQADAAAGSVLQAVATLVSVAVEHHDLLWRLDHRAFHDALTGLPNRILFEGRLEKAVSECRAGGRRGALIYVDLDRFKVVNDSLGHQAGDYFLVECSRRLAEAAVSCGATTVARLGGDEFAVILEGAGVSEADEASARILAALAEPLRTGDQEFVVTASVGIAVFPDDADDQAELTRRADEAMYRAKSAGRNAFAHPAQDANPARRTAGERAYRPLEVEARLRRALSAGEFVLHYQPQVDSRGRVVGAEALVRWQDPQRGLLPPAEFIPVAEESGLIVALGAWVIEAACRQIGQWRSRGCSPVRVAVNVSAAQFAREEFEQVVALAVRKHGLPRGSLELELTESMLVHDANVVAGKLLRIRHAGIHLAIDDFGTGYSSLAYLRRLPVDTLKLDRCFVRDIGDGSGSGAAVARAVVTLGRELRLTTLAEGVETAEQLKFLRSIGCDAVQGYLLGRPAPAEEFEAIMNNPESLRAA